jgi:hypothetical protein
MLKVFSTDKKINSITSQKEREETPIEDTPNIRTVSLSESNNTTDFDDVNQYKASKKKMVV